MKCDFCIREDLEKRAHDEGKVLCQEWKTINGQGGVSVWVLPRGQSPDRESVPDARFVNDSPPSCVCES